MWKYLPGNENQTVIAFTKSPVPGIIRKYISHRTMSFQAYLDNIKEKTGKTPVDFRKLAEKKGLLTEPLKAGPIVEWLKKDFELGHGHAMAIFAVLKNKDFKGGKEK